MNTKTNWIRNALVTTALLALAASVSAAELTRYDAMPGSKMRIEGTSSVHDWQVESKLIGGYVEAGPGFASEPGQKVEPGKVEAKADVFVPVRSLASVEKDGKPYSVRMNEVMHEKLKESASPRITFKLDELTLKEAPKTADAPYVYEAKGQLTVAGKTKPITMPVNVMPLAGKKIKLTGSIPLKMTEFGIEPPSPAIALGLIKTGDDIKILFEWIVGQRPQTPAK